MVQLTEAWAADYVKKFNSMTIRPGVLATALNVAKKIGANKARYDTVEKATGVPWFLVAALHQRESSGNFATYLGNGEPLNRVTRLVPAGRGPFASWEAGAIDALTHEGFEKVTDWSLGSILFHAEAYNGEGYHNKGVPSPYVWAGSNQYTRGKFASDGHYNPSLVDQQLGVAVILAALIQLKLISIPEANSGATPMALTTTVQSSPAIAANPVVAAAVQTSTISLGNIFSSITGMFSGIGLAGILGFVTTFAPTLTGQILLYVSIAGSLVSAGAHAYALVTHISASNSQTIMLVENLLNKVETSLGAAPIAFDNNPSAPAA